MRKVSRHIDRIVQAEIDRNDGVKKVTVKQGVRLMHVNAGKLQQEVKALRKAVAYALTTANTAIDAGDVIITASQGRFKVASGDVVITAEAVAALRKAAKL